MLKKCTYNSQYISHYAQVEPTIILTKTDMRCEETQFNTLSSTAAISALHVFGFESGYQLIGKLKVNYQLLNCDCVH